MEQRDVGAVIILGVGVVGWALWRFRRIRLGGWLLVACGLGLIADDYLGGAFPWQWGLAGAAMTGIGARLLRDAYRRAPADPAPPQKAGSS